MKINMLTKKVIGVVFGLSLLLGIGMTSTTKVQAQYRDPSWQREQSRRQREWEREQRRRQRDAQRDWRYDRNGDTMLWQLRWFLSASSDCFECRL